MKYAKYRLTCETCGSVATDWLSATPTECPNDAEHTIDPESVVVRATPDGTAVLQLIMGAAEPTTQLGRFIDALNERPAFPYLITAGLFTHAEAELDAAVTAGTITADDKTLAMQFVG